MLPIISWKNVWRNKTRSLVVIVAMLIGVFSGTFIIALAAGMVDSRAQSIIANETAHIQIHHPKYADYQEIQYVIDDVSEKINSIKAIPEVKSVTHKYKNMVMTKRKNKSGGMYISAIDRDLDTAVFKINTNLIDGEGTFFEGKKRKPILLSEKLAKKNKMEYYSFDSLSIAKLSETTLPDDILQRFDSYKNETFRDKKAFTFLLKSELSEKEFFEHRNKFYRICSRLKLNRKISISVFGYDQQNRTSAFKVVGYFKTTDAMFDNLNAFVLHEDFVKLAKMPYNTSHEIDILLTNVEHLNEIKEQLQLMYPNLKVETYRDIKPDVAMMEVTMELYTYIIMGIILLALAFGIINTMLMAVLERTKEIGMLKAIGMNRKRVFFMIMYETVYLGLVGGLVGMLLGYFFIGWLEEKGINLSMFQEGFEAMGYNSVLYPKLEPIFFLQVTFLVIIAGVLAAIVPARRALKLNPAEAVRSDI